MACLAVRSETGVAGAETTVARSYETDVCPNHKNRALLDARLVQTEDSDDACWLLSDEHASRHQQQVGGNHR